MCVYACMSVHVSVYLYMYVYIYICICESMCVYIYVWGWVDVREYTCVFVCVAPDLTITGLDFRTVYMDHTLWIETA